MEELRALIDARALIQRAQALCSQYEEYEKSFNASKNTKREPFKQDHEKARISFLMKINREERTFVLALLAKVLPDLRSMELTSEGDTDAIAAFVRAVNGELPLGAGSKEKTH